MALAAVFSYVFVGTLFVGSIAGSAYSSPPLPVDRFVGVSPEDVAYFNSSDVIKCRDGSMNFARAQLNDDFCDCPDGTDEPGTSACPGAKFYCRNAGHTSILIFSSRVNDGICDCCDGSDEYDHKVTCPNTCWEAGRVARERLKKKIAMYVEGVTIRKREVEHATVAIVKDEEELTTLKNEEKTLKENVERLKARKEQIERAEQKQHLEKEKEEKERREAEEIAKNYGRKIEEELVHEKGRGDIEQASETEAIGNTPSERTESVDEISRIEELPEQSGDSLAKTANGETAIDEQPHDVAVQGSDMLESTQALSKEELGRLVASRWTGEKIDEDNEEKSVEDNPEAFEHEEISQDTGIEDDDGYASEVYDHGEKHEYDDSDNSVDEDLGVEDLGSADVHAHSESDAESDSDEEGGLFSWLERIQRTVKNFFQGFKVFLSPIDKSESAQVLKEYDDLSAKLSKMQSRISSLSKKRKHDFGPDKEFYSFYGRCFEIKQNKYMYKVCPFKQATQEEGYSKTQLGQWNKFENSYRTMIFSDGDHCWNGPNRSLKVKLRCGLKNEVTDVDEPSRCEYEALLSTPILCSDDKLKELQSKLDVMNQEKPNSHDEL